MNVGSNFFLLEKRKKHKLVRQGELSEQCNNITLRLIRFYLFPFWRNAKKVAGIEFAGGEISDLVNPPPARPRCQFSMNLSNVIFLSK